MVISIIRATDGVKLAQEHIKVSADYWSGIQLKKHLKIFLSLLKEGNRKTKRTLGSYFLLDFPPSILLSLRLTVFCLSFSKSTFK